MSSFPHNDLINAPLFSISDANKKQLSEDSRLLRSNQGTLPDSAYEKLICRDIVRSDLDAIGVRAGWRRNDSLILPRADEGEVPPNGEVPHILSCRDIDRGHRRIGKGCGERRRGLHHGGGFGVAGDKAARGSAIREA